MRKPKKKRAGARAGTVHAHVRAAGKRAGAAGHPWSPAAARLAMYEAGVTVSRLSPDELATLEAVHHHAHSMARRAPRAASSAPRAPKKKPAKRAAKKAPKKAPKKAAKRAAKKGGSR